MNLKPLALSILLMLSPVGWTSGIPTVDAAALAQRITQMQQLLTQYEEMLNQTGLNLDQLNQLYDSYTQLLHQYDHMLMQAQALKFQLDRRDYAGFLQKIGMIEDVNPFNTGAGDIRQSDSEYAQAGVEQSDHMYGAIKERDEYQEMMRNAFGSTYISPEELQSYNQANMSSLQNTYGMTAKEEYSDVTKELQRLEQAREYLGDESQLASTQFLIEQNQVLLRQQQETNQLLRQQLEMSNQFENQYFRSRQREKERRIQAAIDNANTPIKIDESNQFVP